MAFGTWLLRQNSFHNPFLPKQAKKWITDPGVFFAILT
jgi:hypothetical protein